MSIISPLQPTATLTFELIRTSASTFNSIESLSSAEAYILSTIQKWKICKRNLIVICWPLVGRRNKNKEEEQFGRHHFAIAFETTFL